MATFAAVLSRHLGVRREILAALSGGLLVLSFPKFGHGGVAFLAVAPLLLGVHGTRPVRALRLGWLTGVVWGIGTLYWTALVVVQYGGLSLPVGIAVMALLSVTVALFPALFAWMVARWTAALGPPALLAAPVGWVATEVLRAYTVFRFPWLLLGYSQHENLPLVQIAAYTAVYGVSFLVAVISAVVAYAVVESHRAHGVRAVIGGIALLLGAWGFGTWVISRPLPASPHLRVGLVQASVRQEAKWDPARAAEHVRRHLDLSREAAARGARVVVWPESAVPWDFDRSPEAAAELGAFAQELGIYLLFGNNDLEEDESGQRRYYVAAKMLAPDGVLAFRYHKMRLVPFGEYVPLRPLLLLAGAGAPKLVQQVADFTPGVSATVGEADGHRLGATICYEAIFPDLVRRFATGGAELLVNVTNDAWYGRTSAPYQHFAMSRLRAVENGRYLVRAANTGITAVVDPRGRVVARTNLFERTVLVEDVPILTGQTFYSRHGDLFAWSCLAAAALATAASFLPPRTGPRGARRAHAPPTHAGSRERPSRAVAAARGGDRGCAVGCSSGQLEAGDPAPAKGCGEQPAEVGRRMF